MPTTDQMSTRSDSFLCIIPISLCGPPDHRHMVIWSMSIISILAPMELHINPDWMELFSVT